MPGLRFFGRTVFVLMCLVMLGGLAPTAPRAEAAPAAANLPSGFTDEFITSVESPTALSFLPDGRMLIASKGGELRMYKNGSLLNTPVLNLSSVICTSSEQGLLGTAVDPAFNTNKRFYLFYTYNNNGDCVNRVSRFTMSGDTASMVTRFDLVTNREAGAGNHDGGDIHFGKDGHLYISIGDGGCDYAGNSGCAGANDASRDPYVLFGKILRITKDGGIPADNPFVGTNSGRCNVNGLIPSGKTYCQETFVRGLRNPFRFAMDPNATGTRFFINDVGQNVWEEIDEGQKGADYGWNCREGNHYNRDCSSTTGLTNPIYEYNHNIGCSSITGGAFVPNGLWPGFNNAYLFADYTCGRIWKLTRSTSGAYTRADFASDMGPVIDMDFGPTGTGKALYYTSFAGEVRRIRYTGGNQPPTAVAKASPWYGPVPLTVNFDASGSRDPEGGALTYEWHFNADGIPDATGPRATFTYRTAAPTYYGAHMIVRDVHGAAARANLRIYPGNTPPSPRIAAPTTSKLFRVGERITLQGSATDEQEGTLPASRLSWRVLLHHSTHTHPFFGPQAGTNLTFNAPAPEDLLAATNSYLEIQLTATDSKGLSRTISQRLNPRKVNLTFKTSPAGMNVVVGGITYDTTDAAGKTFVSWDGYGVNVSAPSPQAGKSFSRWTGPNNFTSASRDITITTPDSAATYTAEFR